MAPPKTLGVCIVPDCLIPATGLGYCNRHYQLWRRHGKPESPSYDERLLRRIEQKLQFNTVTGCTEWQGSLTMGGYGIVSVRGKHRTIHRQYWILKQGPVSEGMDVCHHCDNPPCATLDHLFLGTDAENFEDMRSKNRHAYGERAGTAKLTEIKVHAIRLDPRLYTEIARDYKVSGVLISKIKRRDRWGWLPGEIIPSRLPGKLTTANVQAIREAKGLQMDIGRKFGVSQPMVSRIKLGKSWA